MVHIIALCTLPGNDMSISHGKTPDEASAMLKLLVAKTTPHTKHVGAKSSSILCTTTYRLLFSSMSGLT